jgi:hypothetical protein
VVPSTTPEILGFTKKIFVTLKMSRKNEMFFTGAVNSGILLRRSRIPEFTVKIRKVDNQKKIKKKP